MEVKQLKYLAIDILFISSLGLFAAAYVIAADNATVTATVTATNVAVTVNDGVITYGNVGLGSYVDTLAGDLNDLQTASNTGNITEDLDIKGFDSVSWTLDATTSSDQYTHEFSTNTGATWVPLTTGYQAATTSILADNSFTFDLRLHTPTSTTDYDEQSVNVTVLATAS
jgi:hypothetical protein